jgi:hypothetical protein
VIVGFGVYANLYMLQLLDSMVSIEDLYFKIINMRLNDLNLLFS